MQRIIKIMRSVSQSIVLFLIPLCVMGSNNQVAPPPPPSPSPAHQGATNLAMPNVKTPEYVIIRSSEETTFSSETTGKIIELSVKEGNTFNVGDILLKLDCRIQQSDLDKAIAQQKAMQKAYESGIKLKNYGTISEFELVKAKAEADAAKADVNKLNAIVEKCTIIAPYTGAVSELNVHLYETVKPGDPLLKIVNNNDLYFELQVPSRWLSWLKVGSAFDVHIDDINKTMTAEVKKINPEIEPISQTVKITGMVSPADPSLKPGMTGEATFSYHTNHPKE